jgi:hypothetical protein
MIVTDTRLVTSATQHLTPDLPTASHRETLQQVQLDLTLYSLVGSMCTTCFNIQHFCILKTVVFWVVAPCSLVELYRYFRGACLPPSSGWCPDFNVSGNGWNRNLDDLNARLVRLPLDNRTGLIASNFRFPNARLQNRIVYSSLNVFGNGLGLLLSFFWTVFFNS